MTDALELFRSVRQTVDTVGGSDGQGEIREPQPGRSVGTVGGSRDLHDLAMVPGSPAYRARIPRPPCWQCNEDHFPGRAYDHEWQPEPLAVHDEPVSATAINRRPAIDIERVSAPNRVALYVGRGDTYVVAVEAAPDWDALKTFKVAPDMVLPLIEIARALGAKIADKTGGDLLMLEQEALDAKQYAQDHGRGTAGVRDPEPRRQRPGADRPQEAEPEAAELEDGGVPGGSGERRRAARRQER